MMNKKENQKQIEWTVVDHRRRPYICRRSGDIQGPRHRLAYFKRISPFPRLSSFFSPLLISYFYFSIFWTRNLPPSVKREAPAAGVALALALAVLYYSMLKKGAGYCTVYNREHVKKRQSWLIFSFIFQLKGERKKLKEVRVYRS